MQQSVHGYVKIGGFTTLYAHFDIQRRTVPLVMYLVVIYPNLNLGTAWCWREFITLVVLMDDKDEVFK